MVNYKKLVNIINEAYPKGIEDLVKDEQKAYADYHEISEALERAGFTGAAKKFERLSIQEGNHHDYIDRLINKKAKQAKISSERSGIKSSGKKAKVFKVVSVEFGFSENPGIKKGTKVKTIVEANKLLLEASRTAPSDGAYDKTDFKITFSDGEIYNGRYDLQHVSYGGKPDLGEHVKDFIMFYAGIKKPSNLTQEQYDAALKHVNPKEYKEYLEKHDIS